MEKSFIRISGDFPGDFRDPPGDFIGDFTP